MGYYIRVLGQKTDPVPIQKLRNAVQPGVLHLEGEENEWQQLTLSHPTGREIAVIEKNPVIEGQLGAEELREFIEEVRNCKPNSAATWLQQYLSTVKVIYAFQVLGGAAIEDGWSLLQRSYQAVWNHVGGILQSDGEGFSDEAGFTILWQFGEDVTGTWNMGVISDGRFLHFEMDLANEQHRNAFWNGEVPKGVKLV